MDTIDNLKTVLDAGAQTTALVQPKATTDIIVVPDGYAALSAESVIGQHLAAPRRIKANVAMKHLDSFIAYILAFKEKESCQIFISPQGNMIGILDYHSATPAWTEHRVNYVPNVTPEWERWIKSNKVKMTQDQLCEFLEENQDLIVDPAGSALLELVQDLQGKNHIDCTAVTRLQNGTNRLVYSEEVELKGGSTTKPGQVDFPSKLIAGVPPFEGGPSYKVSCRLRYRIESRKLMFWYEIIDSHLIIKDAVKGMVEAVKEKTGIEPFIGTP